MPVVDGTPSIRLEGDRTRGLALIPEGQLLLQRVQAIANRADVPVFSMHQAIGDDVNIYALKAGSVSVISISVAPKHVDVVFEEPEFEIPEGGTFLDFMSGVVTNGIIDTITTTDAQGKVTSTRVVRAFAPTPTCATIEKLNLGLQNNHRLAVEPYAPFGELANPNPDSPLVFSQYVLARSSMWSGKMKKVVQVVMGLGHLSPKKFYNTKFTKEADKEKIKNSLYVAQVGQDGVQVRYDYKFLRTHGIHKAADGKLWLIEIGINRGVLAMPLPIFSGSDKAGFRAVAEARGDHALVSALDELGCLPTGEAFPTSGPLEAKIAKGEILRLMTPSDLSDFYRMSGYSSSCGWAFSESGNEAHNVGYLYDDPDPIQKGMWYQINISIGATKTVREPGEPLAVATAVLVKQHEGYLYSPPVVNSFIPVKYHEPLIDGLLSHSAKPLGPGIVPKCDTVVFVAFMNDELKTCRYFRAGSSGEPIHEITDGRDGCLYEGSWTWTETIGSRSLPEMPYTNDLDPRTVLESAYESNTLISNSMGFDPGVVADFLEAPEGAHITRNKVFKNTYTREIREGERRNACFAVPGYSREAYYYFEGHAYDARHGSNGVSYEYLKDPNTGYSWRKFPRINPPFYPDGWGCATDNCGTTHTDRRIICLPYEGGGCSDYADSGPWLTQCQNVDHLGTPPQRFGYNTNWDKGQDFTGTWNFVSNGLFGPASGPISSINFDKAMTPSPDPATNLIQGIYATHSAIGDDCVIYTQGFVGPRVVAGYLPITLTPGNGMPTIIGVNQP